MRSALISALLKGGYERGPERFHVLQFGEHLGVGVRLCRVAPGTLVTRPVLRSYRAGEISGGTARPASKKNPSSAKFKVLLRGWNRHAWKQLGGIGIPSLSSRNGLECAFYSLGNAPSFCGC